MTNIKKSNRVIALILVIFSLCGMFSASMTTSFADETSEAETSQSQENSAEENINSLLGKVPGIMGLNNNEQKENYVFVNKLKKGNLDVTKTSEDGLVEGFKFQLTGTSMSGQPIDLTATTGEDGIAHFTNIPIGTDFKLNEIEIPDRYVTPGEQTVVIEYNKLTQATMHNALKKVNIFVTKTAEDGVIEGRTFEISGTTEAGNEFKQTGVTDTEGKLTFDDVPYGNYIVKELNTPNYYIVPDEQEVTINADKDINLTFNNALKKGSVKIHKTSEDGKVSSIEFTLKGTSDSGEEIELKATTNDEGIAEIKDIPIGKYTIVETLPDDYYIEVAPQDIEVKYQQTTEVSFHNTLIRQGVTVQKQSEDNKIEGIKFRLYGTSDSGEEVDMTAVTNAGGIAIFENVPVGTYTAEEIEVPDWYIIPEPQTVVVKPAIESEASVTYSLNADADPETIVSSVLSFMPAMANWLKAN